MWCLLSSSVYTFFIFEFLSNDLEPNPRYEEQKGQFFFFYLHNFLMFLLRILSIVHPYLLYELKKTKTKEDFEKKNK